MDLTASISSGWAVALLILGFGFLIFIHEAGHFLVAKAVGIRATQFAVGFGQALLCWRKGIGFRTGGTEREVHRRVYEYLQQTGEWPGESQLADHRGMRAGEPARPDDENAPAPNPVSDRRFHEVRQQLGLGETEYRLNWMPLGGYVKMVGQEDLDPNARSDDPHAFNQKPIWQRVCVVSAGVLMNLLFAVVFFVVAFSYGVEFPPAEVGSVAPGSPADTAEAEGRPDVVGLKPGDRFLRVNGETPSDFTALRVAVALSDPGARADLLVERPSMDEPDEPRRLRFRIASEIAARGNGLPTIGVAPPRSLSLPARGLLDEEGLKQLKERGLRPGMTIVAANGRPIDEHWQLDRIIQRAGGKPITLTLRDEQGTAEITAESATQLSSATLPAPGGKTQSVSHLIGLVPATEISLVQGDSPVKGKLRAGDLIASLEDHLWPSPALVIHLVQSSGGEPMNIRVLRDGSMERMTVTAERPGFGLLGTPKLGIGLHPARDRAVVARVLDDSPLAELDWPAGTRIDRVGETKIGSLTGLRVALQNAGPDAQITYTLPTGGGTQESAPLPARRAVAQKLAELRWGLGAGALRLPGKRVLRQADGPVDAVALGVEKTHTFMVHTYATLRQWIFGPVEVKHLRGPVGIVDAGMEIASHGVTYLLFFLGLISVNLAVINFLPLPIVDGGLFVLLMIEKLRGGKPVPPQIQSAINLAGLVLLGTLFITLTYHDVVRVFTGG